MAEGERVIAVLQRGWVVTGIVDGSADELHLTDASVIRRWGTTKGLGQLALEGPQRDTILDPCGEVRAHPAAVVLMMPCKADAWTSKS